MVTGLFFSYLAVEEAPCVALVEDKRRHGVVRGGEAEVLFGNSHVLVDLVERHSARTRS